MSRRLLQIGDVIVGSFPRNVPAGREQEGYRPAIVVGIPGQIETPRFAVVIVVPLTTYRAQS